MFSLIGRIRMCERKRQSPIVIGPATAGKARNGNIVLSKHISLLTDGRVSNANMNVAVFGNVADNTASYVGPNIMQANGSFVILDPDGDIHDMYAEYLKHNGYMVRRLDLVHMDQSDHYNPFYYVRSDVDIEDLVLSIADNTSRGKKESSPFMVKADRALLAAVFMYVYYYGKEEDKNLAFAADLLNEEAEYLNLHDAAKDDSSPLDEIFAFMQYEEPDSLAVKHYKTFKMATGCYSYRKEIVETCVRKLDIFAIDETADLMWTDGMDIDQIGSERTAVFVIVPKCDNAFNPIAAVFFTQFFRQVHDYCENTAKYTQVVTDGEGNVVRCFKADAESEVKRRAEAEAFLAEAKNGKVCRNEAAGRYEVISSSGELICFRGSEKDAEKALELIKGGKVIDKASRPNAGMTLPVRTAVIFAGMPNGCKIQNFDMITATAHRYNLSISIVIESLMRLQALYNEHIGWIDIIGNCDSVVMSGGGCDSITAGWISRAISRTLRSSRSKIKSSPLVKRITKPKDYSYEALWKLPADKCVIVIKDIASFIDKKIKKEKSNENQ